MIKQISLAIALAVTSATALADQNPMRSERIPQGRGSFLIVQLPAIATEQSASYALTGETETGMHARALQIPLGRGQTSTVWVR